MSIFDFNLVKRVAHLEQRVSQLEKKEQLDMSTVNDAIAKLQAGDTAEGAAIDAVTAAIAALTKDMNTSFANLQGAIGQQPNVTPAVLAAVADQEAHQTKLAAINAALAGLDTSAKAADPGAPTPTPVNA